MRLALTTGLKSTVKKAVLTAEPKGVVLIIFSTRSLKGKSLSSRFGVATKARDASGETNYRASRSISNQLMGVVMSKWSALLCLKNALKFFEKISMSTYETLVNTDQSLVYIAIKSYPSIRYPTITAIANSTHVPVLTSVVQETCLVKTCLPIAMSAH